MIENRAWYTIAERDAPGLTVIDDWSSFGQRTTSSGTVILDNVRVPKTHLVPGYKGYDHPTADGAIFQIIQAAVDAGIAGAAIEDTIRFVRTKSRSWIDSGQEHAWQDPYTIQAVGGLKLRLNAAEALLEKYGVAVDRAVAEPGTESVAAAQIAVAEAKVLTTEIALEATNKLFELAGTRFPPSQWKISIGTGGTRARILCTIQFGGNTTLLGNFYLNGINPPLHAWS